MRPRALSLLLSLVSLSAVSSFLLPARLLLSNGLGQQLGTRTHPRRPAGVALSDTQRRRKKQPRAGVVEESTANSKAPSKSGAPVTKKPQHDAVSCLQNAETGSTVWLVGIVHEATPYVELVKKTIREIKPQVIMLELNPDSIFLLPPGKAHQSPIGMWWWEPEQQVPGGSIRSARSQQRRTRPKLPPNPGNDEWIDADEVWTAGSEAQACGARVLLGDRDSEVSQRREVEADRADSQMLREISNRPGEERKRLERAGKGLQMLMGLIERRRVSGFEIPETRAIVRKHSELHRLLGPRAFNVVITERDEVMAKNLMALGKNTTAVAVVGSAHLDGMEGILSANGWRVKTIG